MEELRRVSHLAGSTTTRNSRNLVELHIARAQIDAGQRVADERTIRGDYAHLMLGGAHRITIRGD